MLLQAGSEMAARIIRFAVTRQVLGRRECPLDLRRFGCSLRYQLFQQAAKLCWVDRLCQERIAASFKCTVSPLREYMRRNGDDRYLRPAWLLSQETRQCEPVLRSAKGQI